jgi:hypothetical protein
LTESSGSILFLKNQNDVVLVKKTKVNRLPPGLVGSTYRVNWVTSSFFFSYFFFNPARFQPQVSRVQVDPLGWAGFQTMHSNQSKNAKPK